MEGKFIEERAGELNLKMKREGERVRVRGRERNRERDQETGKDDPQLLKA